MCRHCSKSKANRPRGLCWSCYYTPGVKEQYPPTSPHVRAGLKGHAREPTEAELEALIAQQMAALPDWWDEDR